MRWVLSLIGMIFISSATTRAAETAALLGALTHGEIGLTEAISNHPISFSVIILLLIFFLITTGITLRLNRKLREANSSIRKTTEVKSLFIANMSHEIRTPLNAVIGMTDLLMDSGLQPKQSEMAEIIRISGESLMDVITDILDFSKIEAGHLELEEQDFDLVQCLEDSLDVIVGKASEKNVEVVYEIDSHVPAVIRGDSGRLRQVLLNLLSNAAKFTQEGEIGVSVTAKLTEHGHQIEFSVHDTGIGIPPEKVEEIFAAFMQADISTTRQFGGTGLGLSISRRLCELMGGTLWAESDEGQGSTFHFSIYTPTARQVKTVYAEQKSFSLRNRDVLVVDDNETNLNILSAQLIRWGLVPVAFDTPAEALESIQSGRKYALMISDMQMPKMDGIMLIREVRRLRRVAELPIIVLTSLGLTTSDPSLDIAAWLIKPAKPIQLYQKIVSILHIDEDGVQQDAAEAEIHFGPLNILVVEDNKLNQKVALRMLEKLGYDADLANDGLEAVEMVCNNDYDMVLMDIQMPNMDGLTATREIRKQPADLRQPLIFAMTAHAAKEDRERGLAAGMDDYITKPIQLVKLKKMIQVAHGNAAALLKAG